jgi:tetratricopeptide (TPR) repeat protein
MAGGRGRWLFRLAAAFGVPAVLLLMTELGLRLLGFGYSTSFLLPAVSQGKKIWVQNNRFTWRYLGPRLARNPHRISIPRAKEPGTIRIFVFGESAAEGDPQMEFGLPRMLQAMFSLRHPRTHFEVVNAAITAINSHVIRDIARDCAHADGDIWVIYMGNNEVVGPYGDGSVFGWRTPALPVIRASLAVKGTRLGQLFEAMLLQIQPPSERSDWDGMKMFLDHRVREADPRMKRTYDYFGRNLAEIMDCGLRAGAGIVVSTVAVNLKDSAPFGSEHRLNLSASDKEAWDHFYRLGVAAQEAGSIAEAAEDFGRAARYDDNSADLRFRQGQCALQLRDMAGARGQLDAARNLDALRFRCDSEMNHLIRRAASNRAGGRVLLADAERALAQHSPDELAGNEFFYEHAHLNFDGNYLLARTIAEQVEKLLPAGVTETNADWPSEAQCKGRMGWSKIYELDAVREISQRLKQAPFTGQLNHATQMDRLSRLARELAPAENPAGIREAQRICEEARRATPDDPELDFQLALLKARGGDLPGAAAALERELDAVPGDSSGWGNLGLFLSRQKKFPEATAAFRRALELDPLNARLRVDAGGNLALWGRDAEAAEQFRQALALQADLIGTRVNLAIALMKQNRNAQALTEWERVLGQDPSNALALQYARQLRNGPITAQSAH